MSRKKAFSMIELSIILVIVGIIAGGVYEGTSIYRKTRLEAARAITKGSPVVSVYGLALWLDAAGSEAFTTNYSNGDSIGQLNDANPQKSDKSNATQSNASLQPIYNSTTLNGLPSIKCDGIDDQLAIASGSNYLPPVSPLITNSFTVFLVALPKSTHEIDTQSDSGTAGNSGQKYAIGTLDGSSQYADSEIAGMGISLGTNGVSVYEESASYLAPIAVYSGSKTAKASIITIDYNNKTPTIFINGNSVATGLTSAKKIIFPSNKFCSNQYGAFNGYIGEVIIYNNRVPQNKRQQIEKYLSKKWEIKIS